ncbi:hypothetical protein AVL62_06410 [Serinicoccus chungangensis]|uniref:Protein-glutamine gamma-glutamyltransferase-like C-terminal domain-containing protein n=1 Tax=Serinicoccus chungangensis TaxID=767452 RepID=A0A0W8IH84_9MICO|nr:DUF4129 domain-containing protein [Serinicoccus chungangensis]KUG59308.1 hypothetical protein AVL62_06410 [Serinicoccus chungangensis]
MPVPALRTLPPVLPAPGAVDPDRDEARRWLQEELDSGDYRLEVPWWLRLWRWVTDRLPDPAALGPLPPWTTWVVLAAVVVAVTAVALFVTRDRWRTGRLAPAGRAGAVLDGRRRSAADYRGAARAALEAGRADEAVLEAFRAIAAGATERTLLEDRPGRTAHEVAVELGDVFGAHAEPLHRAGDTFDAVRYGGHHADTDQARAVVQLDADLDAARPELPGGRRPQMAVPS